MCKCNLSVNDKKYYVNFANTVYNEYRKHAYGIASCSKTRKLWLDELRKDVIEYKLADDSNALSTVNINATLSPLLSLSGGSPGCNVSVQYSDGTSAKNIVEINTNGCITNVNISPNLGGTSFTYNQSCSSPSLVWTISHNLGYVPNVWTEDCNGDDISGTLAVINNNTISITFSTPQAGKAYLS